MQGQKIGVLVIKQLMKVKKLESFTLQYVFEQVISDPTNILENSSSFADLIFILQPNVVMNSGVHFSFHPNCHHQIIHAKFNLKIFYPPHYERVVWSMKMQIMI